MIRVDIKALTKLLNKFCIDSFNKAAGICLSRGNYEVTVEHVLMAMTESTTADIQRILRHFEIEPARTLRLLQRDMESLRSGNPGKPVLSPILMELLQETWLLASVEYRMTEMRSGVFLAALVSNPARYGVGSYLDELEKLRSDVLRRDLLDIVAGSPEDPAEPDAKVSAAPSERQPRSDLGGDTALARFTINFTERARRGEIDPVFARDREMRQIINILGRRQKNNPIIVSEPGVGKTAMVGELARRIVNGNVPDILRDVEVLALDMGLLQAGAGVRGEFENRLKSVISEVKASPKPIILFIDEAHTMIGAGGPAGGSDAANLLKPALARGELRTIAATTWSEYKKYFEKDPALARRFQLVKLENPTDEDAVVMLRGLREKYESAHNVHILDNAVVAAGRLASRYISGRQHPDKGVDLIDTAASRVKLSLTSKPDVIDDTERKIEMLERELRSLHRDKETGAEVEESRIVEIEKTIQDAKDELARLTARWQREKEAAEKVLAIRRRIEEVGKAKVEPKAQEASDTEGAAAADRRVSERTDSDSLKRELEKALADLHEIQGKQPLIHLQVDEDVIAKVVADMTGIPVGRMVRDEAESILRLEEELGKRLKGQPHVIEAVCRGIRAAKAGLKNPNTPMGVFLFVGPSGTGKTECALIVADLLFGGEQFMTIINMSEFQERHTVSRLIGSPPGYVGYGEGGVLTEAVRQRPYSVVLLDEVEKADLEVLNLFYQVFDKGMLADGEGRVIDFKNTVLFMTSNLASDAITQMCASSNPPDAEAVTATIRPILSHHFRPALLARMTIVPFFTISPDAMKEIVSIKLNQLGRRLWDNHRMAFEYDPGVVEQIATRCAEVETGARNIDHIMHGTLLPGISTHLLQQMTVGPLPDKLMLGLSDEGDFTFQFS